MPFKASRRHEFWSCDVRSIEEHLLPDPRPVFVITVFENVSRMVLASAISPSQNQWDYLAVLAEALRRYGTPEVLVTDGGTIFYSNQAMQFYDLLGIRKDALTQASRGRTMLRPYSRYKEGSRTMHFPMHAPGRRSSRLTRPGGKTTLLSTTLPIETARTGDTAPNAVLRGVLGRTYPEAVLWRVLYATQFTRHLDRHGYIRCKHWRLFGENGLAGEEVSVWVYEGTLKIQATAFSLYSVRLSPD
jgi:putative transposase